MNDQQGEQISSAGDQNSEEQVLDVADELPAKQDVGTLEEDVPDAQEDVNEKPPERKVKRIMTEKQRASIMKAQKVRAEQVRKAALEKEKQVKREKELKRVEEAKRLIAEEKERKRVEREAAKAQKEALKAQKEAERQAKQEEKLNKMAAKAQEDLVKDVKKRLSRVKTASENNVDVMNVQPPPVKTNKRAAPPPVPSVTFGGSEDYGYFSPPQNGDYLDALYGYGDHQFLNRTSSVPEESSYYVHCNSTDYGGIFG